jgi:hypothetical protein
MELVFERNFSVERNLRKMNNSDELNATKLETRKNGRPPKPPKTDNIPTILVTEALKFNAYHELGDDECVEIHHRITDEYE